MHIQKKYIKITLIGIGKKTSKSYFLAKYLNPNLRETEEDFYSTLRDYSNYYEIHEASFQHNNETFRLFFQNTVDILGSNYELFPALSRDTDVFLIFLDSNSPEIKQQTGRLMTLLNIFHEGVSAVVIGAKVKKIAKELKILQHIDIDTSQPIPYSKILNNIIHNHISTRKSSFQDFDLDSRSVKESAPSATVHSLELKFLQDSLTTLPDETYITDVLSRRKFTARDEVILNLIESEYKYLRNLMFIHHLYRNPFEFRFNAKSKTIFNIFGNMKELEKLSRCLLPRFILEFQKPPEEQALGAIFLEYLNDMEIFKTICANSGSAAIALNQFRQSNPILEIYFAEVAQIRRLSDLNFIVLVQEIPFIPINHVRKYQSVLNDLKATSPADSKDVVAIDRIIQFFNCIIDNIASEAKKIEKQVHDIKRFRHRFILKEPVTISNARYFLKKNYIRVEYKKKIKKRLVFLFSNSIIIVKKVPKIGPRDYWLKGELNLSNITISSKNSKMENLILTTRSKETATFYFSSAAEREMWSELLSSLVSKLGDSREDSKIDLQCFSTPLIPLNSDTSNSSPRNDNNNNNIINSNSNNSLEKHYLAQTDVMKKIPKEFQLQLMTYEPIKSAKLLILNVLHHLHEYHYIDQNIFLNTREVIRRSSLFDVSVIATNGPPSWGVLAHNLSSFSGLDEENCSYTIRAFCHHIELPWRTVMTTHTIFQRACVHLSIENGLAGNAHSYFKTLCFHDRMVLIGACILLASKVEETPFKLSELIELIKKYWSELKWNTLESDIIQSELEILSILGFNLELPHPHFFIRLLQVFALPSYNLLSGEAKTLRWKSFILLDSIQREIKRSIPLYYDSATMSLGALFLAWVELCSAKEKHPFCWNVFTLSPSHIHDLKDFIEEVISLNLFPNVVGKWEQYMLKPFQFVDNNIKKKDDQHSSPRVVKAERCRSFSDYKMIKTLGEGTFGEVYLGRDCKTNELYAIKLLKSSAYQNLTKNGFPNIILREILYLKRLKHPNIVSGREMLLKIDRGTHNFYIVMEKMSCDLLDLWTQQIQQTVEPLWREKHVKHLIYQILSGMAYMHSRGLMHRDIKPGNVLFRDDGVVKVADLGSLRDATHSALRYSISIGSLWYRAPELLAEKGEYSNAVDLWAIGCVLVELLRKRNLFVADSLCAMSTQIVQCLGLPLRDEIPKFFPHLPVPIPQGNDRLRMEFLLIDFSDNCLDLVRRLLTYDPAKRITAEEALEHPYFKEEPLPEVYAVKFAGHNRDDIDLEDAENMKCQVVYSFIGEERGDLEIHHGDIIENVVKHEAGWWKGTLHGKQGVFPANYVVEVEEPTECTTSDSNASDCSSTDNSSLPSSSI